MEHPHAAPAPEMPPVSGLARLKLELSEVALHGLRVDLFLPQAH